MLHERAHHRRGQLARRHLAARGQRIEDRSLLRRTRDALARGVDIEVGDQCDDALLLELHACGPSLDVGDQPAASQLLERRSHRGGHGALGRDAQQQLALARRQRAAVARERRLTHRSQLHDGPRRDAASRRQRSPHDLARRRLVVVRDPRAQLDKLGGQRRRVVEHLVDIDRRHAFWRGVGGSHHHARDLARPEPHEHARADPRSRREVRGHAIVIAPSHWQRDGDLDQPKRSGPISGHR